MDIEEEIALAYLMTSRMRMKREKTKPRNKAVRRIFQKREEEGVFALFHYFSWCFIILAITIICFTPEFLLKFFLSHFLIFFVKTFSMSLQMEKIILNKNQAVVSAKCENIIEDQKRSLESFQMVGTRI